MTTSTKTNRWHALILLAILAAPLLATKAVATQSAAAAPPVLRLAQAGPVQDRPAPLDAPRSMEDQYAENYSPGAENAIQERVIVIGSHIRGVGNETAPAIILDREYIDSTGYTTTTRLMESLPQNFALANQTVSFNDNVSVDRARGASINLRGIGEGTTLVLINGRRMAPGFLSSAADISALPLSAIERVEVLTDGASALYGSDAVGGVVNFVLRIPFTRAGSPQPSMNMPTAASIRQRRRWACNGNWEVAGNWRLPQPTAIRTGIPSAR